MMNIKTQEAVEVEAESEEQAKQNALELDLSTGDLSWEALDSFGEGNVCHCPPPWEITAEEIK